MYTGPQLILRQHSVKRVKITYRISSISCLSTGSWGRHAAPFKLALWWKHLVMFTSYNNNNYNHLIALYPRQHIPECKWQDEHQVKRHWRGGHNMAKSPTPSSKLCPGITPGPPDNSRNPATLLVLFQSEWGINTFYSLPVVNSHITQSMRELWHNNASNKDDVAPFANQQGTFAFAADMHCMWRRRLTLQATPFTHVSTLMLFRLSSLSLASLSFNCCKLASTSVVFGPSSSNILKSAYLAMPCKSTRQSKPVIHSNYI